MNKYVTDEVVGIRRRSKIAFQVAVLINFGFSESGHSKYTIRNIKMFSHGLMYDPYKE